MENKQSYGLWYKTSQKGLKYATGYIKVNGEKKRVTLFKNDNKKSEKSPDFTIIM